MNGAISFKMYLIHAWSLANLLSPGSIYIAALKMQDGIVILESLTEEDINICREL